MRFYDFLTDIKETSERISERNANLDVDINAGLTLRTLLRPDVSAFFDEIVAAHDVALPATKTLLFYTVLYAYIVNVRPRPVYSDLLDFTQKLLAQMQRMDLNTEKGKVLCETAKIQIPKALVSRLRPAIKINQKAGLQCRYAQAAPDAASLNRICDPRYLDASLMLCRDEITQRPEGIKFSDRIVFSGVIFKSQLYSFSGYYIKSLN